MGKKGEEASNVKVIQSEILSDFTSEIISGFTSEILSRLKLSLKFN